MPFIFRYSFFNKVLIFWYTILMKIYKTINHIAGENTYYLVNDQAVILIDPGSNGQEIIAKIKSFEKPLVAILLTHTHYDHIFSLDLVRDAFDHPPVYVSEKEAAWLSSPDDNLSGLGRHDDIITVIARPADNFFKLKQPYQLNGFEFTVLPTPGHSWGGVSFVFHSDELVVTGDALFRETIGRTDLPTSNFEDLITGIHQELFTLPNHYRVYPGHGPSTTICHEKNANPFFH
ncbi:TPA: MBL fold metallo-hydrolase [Streptococcus pyogenes]|nr:MBL fold metallo-hydrolase [Streptococcus pyogenes]HER6477583.1 MBL fold metallo-hydrolase [Streptococcus pyogenes]HER6481307.1 MBL fold metallo-hydrolase [Streptococcus pyogenes]HER6484628.1 MBL fold metallo-hydrolase [Streptococcus pyogenes]HER6486198.1 MBL fold metallo-hydrolase [Streptococcus pyogenes]